MNAPVYAETTLDAAFDRALNGPHARDARELYAAVRSAIGELRTLAAAKRTRVAGDTEQHPLCIEMQGLYAREADVLQEEAVLRLNEMAAERRPR